MKTPSLTIFAVSFGVAFADAAMKPRAQAPAVADSTIAALRARPLVLPRLRAGDTCPRTPTPSFAATGAVGAGPVFARGFDAAGHLLGESNDGATKILWQVAKEYSGPVLVRGISLETGAAIRFRGDSPQFGDDLVIAAGEPSARRQQPSNEMVSGSGCFAFQIDGTTFTETLPFRTSP